MLTTHRVDNGVFLVYWKGTLTGCQIWKLKRGQYAVAFAPPTGGEITVKKVGSFSNAKKAAQRLMLVAEEILSRV